MCRMVDVRLKPRGVGTASDRRQNGGRVGRNGVQDGRKRSRRCRRGLIANRLFFSICTSHSLHLSVCVADVYSCLQSRLPLFFLCLSLSASFNLALLPSVCLASVPHFPLNPFLLFLSFALIFSNTSLPSVYPSLHLS